MRQGRHGDVLCGSMGSQTGPKRPYTLEVVSNLMLCTIIVSTHSSYVTVWLKDPKDSDRRSRLTSANRLLTLLTVGTIFINKLLVCLLRVCYTASDHFLLNAVTHTLAANFPFTGFKHV